MAILIEDQVKAIALSKVDDLITLSREQSDHLRLHFYGKKEDVTKYLTEVEGLENEGQLNLRRKFAVSNEFLVENLLRPIDNVWSAKGGSLKVDFKSLSENKEKKFIESTNNISDSMPVKAYLENVWFDRFITDPNGLVFMEVKDGKTFPTYKSIYSIKNYKTKGIHVEWVCFEPDIEDESYFKLWVVDDAFYYRVKVRADSSVKLTGVESDVDISNAEIIEMLPNSFGEVPAVLNSPIFNTLDGNKLSPISKQVELLDNYLVNNSVAQIYKFLHDYPIFWQYMTTCMTCKGEGYVEENGESVKCSSCNSTGYSVKKDVSDVKAIKPPESNEDPIITPNVAGYVQPAPMFEEHREQLRYAWDVIYFSHWGTTTEKLENETATARFIDTQPINNRLNKYADIIENVTREILRYVGIFEYPETFVGIDIHYGRRFMIETPDQLWEKYRTAKEKNMPIITLDNILEQYYESEYQKNVMLLRYYVKLIKIEPFIHNTYSEISGLTVNEIDKNAKYYFSDWIKSKMINEIIDVDLETLKKDLYEFTNFKLNQNGNKTNGQESDGQK